MNEPPATPPAEAQPPPATEEGRSENGPQDKDRADKENKGGPPVEHGKPDAEKEKDKGKGNDKKDG